MGEGGCCFEFCELCVDNAEMPKLIKNYCSGAAGFAKRQKVLPKLLRVSVVFTELFYAIVGCAPFCCFFHSTHVIQLWNEFVITCWFFFRQALSDAPKSPLRDLLNVKRSYPNCCACPLSSLNYFMLLWVVHLSVVSFTRRT